MGLIQHELSLQATSRQQLTMIHSEGRLLEARVPLSSNPVREMKTVTPIWAWVRVNAIIMVGLGCWDSKNSSMSSRTRSWHPHPVASHQKASWQQSTTLKVITNSITTSPQQPTSSARQTNFRCTSEAAALHCIQQVFSRTQGARTSQSARCKQQMDLTHLRIQTFRLTS